MRNLLPSPASLLLLVFAGCAQKGPQAVPIKAADSYASKAHAEGLVAGAEPFDTYRKSTDALGKNVNREFTPVQLVVESSASDKFLVHREGAKLLCTDGTTLEPVSALHMFEHYREPFSAAVQFGFARPAPVTSDGDNRTMADWVNKEFPPVAVLETGGRVGGLLYFRGTCPVRMGRQVRMTANKMTSSDVVSFSIELR